MEGGSVRTDDINRSIAAEVLFATPSFDEKGPELLKEGDCCVNGGGGGGDPEATRLKGGALRTAAAAAGKPKTRGAHPSSFSSPSMRVCPYAVNAHCISTNTNNSNFSSSRTPPIITTNTRTQQQRGVLPHPNALTARPPPSTTATSSSSSSRRNTSTSQPSTPLLPPEEKQREREKKTMAADRMDRTAVHHYPLLSPSWPPQEGHEPLMPLFFHQNDQPHFMEDSVVVAGSWCRSPAVGSHRVNNNINNRFNEYGNVLAYSPTPSATAPTTGTGVELTPAMRGDAGPIGSSYGLNNNIIGGNSRKSNSATTLLHTAISQLRAAGALPFVVDAEAFHGEEKATTENGFLNWGVDCPTSVVPSKPSLQSSSSSSAAAVMAAVTAARRSIALKNLERDLLSGKWSGADTAAVATATRFPDDGSCEQQKTKEQGQQQQQQQQQQEKGRTGTADGGGGGLIGCVNLHINVGEYLRTYIHLHEDCEDGGSGSGGSRNLKKMNEEYQQQRHRQTQSPRRQKQPQKGDDKLDDNNSFSLANSSLLDLIYRAINKFERTEQQQQQQLFSNSDSAFQNEGNFTFLGNNKEGHRGADERSSEFENKIKAVVNAVAVTKTGLATRAQKGGLGSLEGQTIIVIPIISVVGENESMQRNTQTGNLGLTHRFSNVNNDYLLSPSSSCLHVPVVSTPMSTTAIALAPSHIEGADHGEQNKAALQQSCPSSPPFYSSSYGGPYAAPSFASSFISGAAGEFTSPTGIGVRAVGEGGNSAINNTMMTMTATTTPRPPATIKTNNNKKSTITNPNQPTKAFGNRQVHNGIVERERPLRLVMGKENEREGIRVNVSASSRLFRFPRIDECVSLLSFSSSARASSFPSSYSNFGVPTTTTTAHTVALSSHTHLYSSSSFTPPTLLPPPPPQPILVLCIAQTPSSQNEEVITSNPWEPTYLSNHCVFRLYAAAAGDSDEYPHLPSHQNQSPPFLGSSSSSTSSSSLQKWKRFGGDAVESLFAYCNTNTLSKRAGVSTSSVGPEEEYYNSVDNDSSTQHRRTSAPNNNSNNNGHGNNLSATSSALLFIEACRRRDAFYASVRKAFSRVLLLTLQSRGEQQKRRKRRNMVKMKDGDQENTYTKSVRPHRPTAPPPLHGSSGSLAAVPPPPPTPPTRARGHYTHPFAKNDDVSLHAARPVRQQEQEKGVESGDRSTPWAHLPKYSGPFDAHIGFGGSGAPPLSLSDSCDGFLRWDWKVFYDQLMDGLCLSVSHDLVGN